ncbi:uncharacterized protein LOC135833751 [Planococcus citri]|uniref:uncharacterized protein LOC135833751 n=1 Tax=Planococcus citri TaxID=170843 RepID=UPI0031F894F2
MCSRGDIEDTSETETNTADLRNNEFVKLLEENKILFDKSQSPYIQKKKKECIERIQRSYLEKTNKAISTQQIRKRLCNMKSEVRKYLRNDCYSKPVRLKDWHRSVMALMNEHGDFVDEATAEIPTSSAVPTQSLGMEYGSDSGDSYETGFPLTDPLAPQISISELKFSNLTNHISPYERLTNETDQTKNLSNNDLERAVLLAKYELTTLQIQVFKEQIELINLQKKNVEKNIPID